MGRHKSSDTSPVFDVSKPGRSAPSHTSRPIIVDQHDIGNDPMVTGASNKESLMTHSTGSVVPIAVSSGGHQNSVEATKEKGSSQADNFFGNTPETAAGEQSTYTPEAKPESPSSNAEPFSGKHNSSGHETLGSPQVNENPHSDSQLSDDRLPLPAGLTAPEADDPVGLSSIGPPEVSTPIPSGLPAESQQAQAANNEDRGAPPPNDSASPAASKNTEELPPVPENIGEIETLPFPAHPHHNVFVDETHGRKWLIPSILILVIGAFFILDAGVIGSGNLPFEIIKEKEETVAVPQPATPLTNNAATSAAKPPPPAAPTGISEYKLFGTPLSFSYPTAWGNPSVTVDSGFSKRGGNNKSDGIYTQLIGFANNKDLQLALTSNKYLPAARPLLYYDFLQWCTGTHDGKIYRQKLLFSTTSGVDTPSTITCSDGPLGDAAKIDELTIVQKNTKDAAGKTAGDIYARNLTDKEFVILRIKDSVMTNSDAVKQLLTTVKMTPQASN